MVLTKTYIIEYLLQIFAPPIGGAKNEGYYGTNKDLYY